MGCFGSKIERQPAQVSTIRTPKQLGYSARPIGEWCPDNEYCFYELTYRLANSDEHLTIAKLGISLDPHESDIVFVDVIATGQDPRGDRPKSGEVFLSFWEHVCHRRVSRLRRLLFSDVFETGITSVDGQVCALLGVDSLLTVSPTILRFGRTDEEKEIFQILEASPFAKATKRMISSCPDLRRQDLKIVRFDYTQPPGYNPHKRYDFMITLGR